MIMICAIFIIVRVKIVLAILMVADRMRFFFGIIVAVIHGQVPSTENHLNFERFKRLWCEQVLGVQLVSGQTLFE